jgi:hypothetical protein
MSNWYFRCANHTPSKSYFLSDVSAKERLDGKYYCLDNSYGLFQDDKPLIRVNSIPKFDITFNTSDEYTTNGRIVGCLFNCPNEDFTEKKDVSAAKGNYIYDLCWRDFINERYNSNNKKVTAYFNLSVVDYQSFNFNKFILFNNQLFVVNKIVDFNPNSYDTTKVELIQVSDINGYVGQNNLFPIMSCSTTAITVEGEYGSDTIRVRCYPYPDDVTVVHDTPLSEGQNVMVEDIERMGIETHYTITWEGFTDRLHYTGTLVIVSGNETLEIPIEING